MDGSDLRSLKVTGNSTIRRLIEYVTILHHFCILTYPTRIWLPVRRNFNGISPICLESENDVEGRYLRNPTFSNFGKYRLVTFRQTTGPSNRCMATAYGLRDL